MTSDEYTKQLNKFSRTIEAKSEHKATVIKNRIAHDLDYEYKCLQRINDMELNADNVGIVRSLLNRVFEKLVDNGIDFI